MRPLLSLAVIAALLGCGPKKTAAPPPALQPLIAGDEIVMQIKGPKGTLKIGDELSKAKLAFPKPLPAEEITKPSALKNLGGKVWGWRRESTQQLFEARAENGKITDIIMIRRSPQDENGLADLLLSLGTPTFDSMGVLSGVYLWQGTSHEKLLIVKEAQRAAIETWTTVLGPIGHLKKLGYSTENLNAIAALADKDESTWPMAPK